MCVSSLSFCFFLISILYVNVRNALINNNNNKKINAVTVQIKGNNIWTRTSPCEHRAAPPLPCTSREGRWPGNTQIPFLK